MRHVTVSTKLVAFYTEKSDRTIRRMCESGELDATLFGGEWAISVPGLKRRFRCMGREFWHRICYAEYPDRRDAEAAYQEFLEIDAVCEAEERARLKPSR